MQTITFKCPDKLGRQLETESAELNIRKSDLLRRALVYYLARKGISTHKSSLFALSEDLCGSVEGPEDLSTNFEYLEGYGE